jgi:peptidoglycan/LPS O-acetylase OafA/YrhL
MAARPHIDQLTALRFFAALMIVAHHAGGQVEIFRSWASAINLDLGVSFFYVLSGFILSYNYPKLERGRETGRFFVARIARIWPLHLFMIAAFVLVLPYPWSYPAGPGAIDTLAIAFLLQAWVPYGSAVFGINGVAWSISVELFFYALFPLLIADWRRTWVWKLALSLFLAIAIASTADALLNTEWKWGDTGLMAPAFGFLFPPVRLAEFIMGICACSVYRWSLEKWPDRHWSTFVEMGALVLLIVAMKFVPAGGGWLLNNGYIGPVTAKWIAEGGCGPFFAAFVCLIALTKGVLTHLLRLRLLVLLGEISFSIYMVHVFVIEFMRLGGLTSLVADGPLRLVFLLGAILAVSYSTWRFIERGGRQAILSLYDRWVAPGPSKRRSLKIKSA